MEWKYLDKEQPRQSGEYLIYCLNGSLSIAKWDHIFMHKYSDGGSYYSASYCYGATDLGEMFVTRGKGEKPIKGVVMWCDIPPLPDDMKKEAAQIKRYKEQIKELRERIKKLENKEES